MVDENNVDKGSSRVGKMARAGMQIVGGAIPFAGGFLSAAANAWSEHEQEKAYGFLKNWLEMLKDEIREKEQTIIEITSRLDMHDEKIADRISSREYQSLLKKAFREWSGVESEEKRRYVRNILANAAAAQLASDDVVRLFLDWLRIYSELHFQVIGVIYNHRGITRGEIWDKIGKGQVREDSADADLFKLLIRDLSTGSVLRQHRETDYYGNFVIKKTGKKHITSNVAKSAFDREEGYELTQLGEQFVHYAMTDLPLKIEYKSKVDSDDDQSIK